MREILITNENKYSSTVTIQNNLQLTDVSIKTIFNSSDLRVSVEICANRKLDWNLLSEIPCSFCSVTWFAPTTEELENVENIPAIQLATQLRCRGYSVLLHLAGRNLKRYHVLRILKVVKDAGIRNIFALQGDASQIKEQDNRSCDFPYAADLVKFIRSCYGDFFTIGVAGYPEKHPKSESFESDLEYLKYKVSSGADFIITQACFNYSSFSNFKKQCLSNGILIPIIPGIFVISSYRTLIAMSTFCCVPIPKNILEIVENNKAKDITVKEFGIVHTSELMNYIFENEKSFGGIHLFSLNNFELLRELMKKVGICLSIERPFSVKNNLKKNKQF